MHVCMCVCPEFIGETTSRKRLKISTQGILPCDNEVLVFEAISIILCPIRVFSSPTNIELSDWSGLLRQYNA